MSSPVRARWFPLWRPGEMRVGVTLYETAKKRMLAGEHIAVGLAEGGDERRAGRGGDCRGLRAWGKRAGVPFVHPE